MEKEINEDLKELITHTDEEYLSYIKKNVKFEKNHNWKSDRTYIDSRLRVLAIIYKINTKLWDNIPEDIKIGDKAGIRNIEWNKNNTITMYSIKLGQSMTYTDEFEGTNLVPESHIKEWLGDLYLESIRKIEKEGYIKSPVYGIKENGDEIIIGERTEFIKGFILRDINDRSVSEVRYLI